MLLVWNAVFGKDSIEESKVAHKKRFTPEVWWNTLVLTVDSFSLEFAFNLCYLQKFIFKWEWKSFFWASTFNLSLLVLSLYNGEDISLICSPSHPSPELCHYLNKVYVNMAVDLPFFQFSLHLSMEQCSRSRDPPPPEIYLQWLSEHSFKLTSPIH